MMSFSKQFENIVNSTKSVIDVISRLGDYPQMNITEINYTKGDRYIRFELNDPTWMVSTHILVKNTPKSLKIFINKIKKVDPEIDNIAQLLNKSYIFEASSLNGFPTLLPKEKII